MSFWDGLQETILAGVDGYVSIETAKAQSQPVEQTPPVPTIENNPPSSRQEILPGVSNTMLWLGAAALVGVVLVINK